LAKKHNESLKLAANPLRSLAATDPRRSSRHEVAFLEKERKETPAVNTYNDGQNTAGPAQTGAGTSGRNPCRQELLRLPGRPLMC